MIEAWLSASEMIAVRVEARAVEDRVVGSEERGEALLQVAVDLLRAADEANGRHAEAPAVERLLRRVDDLGVAREAEVVVRAEVDQLAGALDRDMRGLRRRHHELVLRQAGLLDLWELRAQVVAERGHAAAQSRITLPDSPDAAAVNAASWSS